MSLDRRLLMCVYNKIDYDGRVQRSAETLANRYSVSVVAIDSGKGYANKKFNIETVRLFKLNTFKFVNHFLFWFRVMLSALRLRPHVVYAHDFFMAFPGWLAAKLIGAKFIYDAHELIIPEQGLQQSPRDTVFYFFERYVVTRADLVIAANEDRCEVMKQFYHLQRTPTAIRNLSHRVSLSATKCIDTSSYSGIQPVEELDAVRLVYQGDINIDRGIDRVIKSFKYLPDRYSLYLIGDGPHLHEVRRLIVDKELHGRVHIVPAMPREELHSLLKQFDIGIITYSYCGLNNVLCASNKLYEYVQNGLMVVSTSQPPLSRDIISYNLGAIIDDNYESHIMSEQEIAGVIMGMNRSPEWDVQATEFLERNNWETESEHLISVVESLFK